MAKAMDRDIRRLYARLYDRNDITVSRLGMIVIASVAVLWLVSGLVNYAVLGRDIPRPRERAILALGYGPAFGPLHVARSRSTVRFFGRRLSVRQGATLVGGGALALCVLPFFLGGEQRGRQERWRRAARNHAEQQGRLPPTTVRRKLRLPGDGLPLALVEGEVIGIPFGEDRGHCAVIAPTRSGKGLHLTEALLRWPGAAVVLDPKGEQWARTAGTREQWGPVYRLPSHHGIDLADSFNLQDPLDVQELHQNLLRVWQDREPIFGEKSLALFHAAVACGQATNEHPLRLLARWAEMAAPAALHQAAMHAPNRIAQFTDGDLLRDDAPLNRFAQSAWGTFTARFAPLIPHIETVTCGDIPKDWLAQRATIYITYHLDQLPTAGALVSSIFAACIKAQMREADTLGAKTHALFALDELPATALAKLDTYISTIGGYGGTLLLYLQTISQLDDVYGKAKARTILGNCHTKLYYPPRDMETAEHVAKVFGTELCYVRSDSSSSRPSASGGQASHGRQTSTTYAERVAPALAPTELDALPACAVIVLAQADKQYRVLAERLNPIPKLLSLPPPPALGQRGHPHQPAPVAPEACATSRPHGEVAASAPPAPTAGQQGDTADGYF